MITGIVVSSVDSTPLAGCSVSQKGTLITTNTNASGQWQLDLPVGTTIVITAPGGYKQAEIIAQENNRTVLQKDTGNGPGPSPH